MAPLDPDIVSMPSPPAVMKRPLPMMEGETPPGPATAAVSTLRTSSSSVSFLTIDEDVDTRQDQQQQQQQVSLPLTESLLERTNSITSGAPPIPPPSHHYYDKGSVELAIETPVMMQRLEKRRRLTGSGANDGGDCLLIVLVGLPARGKSFIARKLLNYFSWRGNQCQIFNVGKYRRKIAQHEVKSSQAATKEETVSQNNCKADFFDDSNQEAARMRKAAAELAMKETLNWLECGNVTGTVSSATMQTALSFSSLASNNTDALEDMDVTSGLESHSTRRQYHRIAIFDATNTTKERRQWILQECAKKSESLQYSKRIGVLFLESICDDPELLAENFKVKIGSCPDFKGFSQQEALTDLNQRIQKYEERYEPLEDHSHESFIKIFNLSSRLMVNHIYGRLAKVVLPAIMAWNTGSRPIFLCRAGETKAMEEYTKQHGRQDDNNSNKDKAKFLAATRRKSDRLGERGRKFRDALYEFIEKEGLEFMNRRNDTFIHPTKMDTGTSISGLHETRDHTFDYTVKSRNSDNRANAQPLSIDDSSSSSSGTSNTAPSFPCLVLSSTMPRAIETATWKQNTLLVKDVSNLNPLDMGDFTGMDLYTIQKEYPEWYDQLQREPFYTRFPGGESYSDLIDRLYTIIIDIEQQLGLATVVSHVSVLQVLISYFRSTPIQQCMDIEVPLHTVFKFTPLRGGGWLESQHVLLPNDGRDEVDSGTIWDNIDGAKQPMRQESSVFLSS
ncbi:bifunctional 6-phosphofructo-2-kinase [Nitzschia inconspicua]|uniref:Bifunctional 6-phosphofructo-2-kinase n=1 Tax=Nitzschia inconspicua TaxID=303405 RepID=A0A9K3LX33_9STRA|nr:bifunctional 6-phosphofructo-2-kinase [Nitzschia inconspicua]